MAVIAQPNPACNSAAPLALSTLTTAVKCFGDSNGTATANPTGGFPPYTYSWNTVPVQTTKTATGLKAGTYSVTITDSSCMGKTITGTVTVSQPGLFKVNTSGNVTINKGSSTTLNASGGVTYTWIPATGLSCDTCPNPTANPTVTTTYYLTSIDSNGCISADSLTVTVIDEIPCGDVFVSNSFSPNSDGQNDTLYVRGNCITTLSFVVYDRWGNKVFETTEISKGWDGRYHEKDMQPDVFVFYLEATLKNGGVVRKKGNVNLVR